MRAKPGAVKAPVADHLGLSMQLIFFCRVKGSLFPVVVLPAVLAPGPKFSASHLAKLAILYSTYLTLIHNIEYVMGLLDYYEWMAS